VKPYPKEQQLARGHRRYKRKVASPKQWQAIIAAKIGPCRVCTDPARNGSEFGRIQMHHLVTHHDGGHDREANIVPLCPGCHADVTVREPFACAALVKSLTDAELAEVRSVGGAGYLERAYGVER